MTAILAIDQSTSATKAVLFDAAGRVFDRASREHRQIYPQPGWVEHDAEEIWQNVLAVLSEVGRQAASRNDVVGLAITNQRETFVVFDRQTGKPLHQRDRLAVPPRRSDLPGACKQPVTMKSCASKTGLKLDTYFSGPKLKWLLRESPELAGNLSAAMRSSARSTRI